MLAGGGVVACVCPPRVGFWEFGVSTAGGGTGTAGPCGVPGRSAAGRSADGLPLDSVLDSPGGTGREPAPSAAGLVSAAVSVSFAISAGGSLADGGDERAAAGKGSTAAMAAAPCG